MCERGLTLAKLRYERDLEFCARSDVSFIVRGGQSNFPLLVRGKPPYTVFRFSVVNTTGLRRPKTSRFRLSKEPRDIEDYDDKNRFSIPCHGLRSRVTTTSSLL